MSRETLPLTRCTLAATTRTPLIVRNVIKAGQCSQPLSRRQYHLSEAIRHTRELLDSLATQQTELGWPHREGDAA